MKSTYISSLLLIVLSWSCQHKDQTAGETLEEDTFVHPDTPEEVVRQYQYYLDNDKYTYAKRLSTPAGQEILNYLEKRLSDQPADSTIINTEFLSIVCRKTGEEANCIGVIEEEGEKFELVFKVIKIDGKWLVDANEDDYELEYDSTIEDDFSSDPEI